MSTQIGRILGQYRLISEIGSGNLGKVFQAESMASGEGFAVKVVHEALSSDPGFPGRFERVVSAAQRLTHPNIVRIFEYGPAQTDYYVAMELLQRGSLRTMLERREDRPSIGRVVGLIQQAAEALAHAHNHGVVHRDMKPENIMLARSRSGDASSANVRVVDFGMMQLIDTGATMVGNRTPGSPRYMSPEQCSGRAIDARSDIYSLGVVLYEAATGYPPFQVQSLAEAIPKHLTATPPSPRSVNGAVPPDLEAIILRCLAKRPDDRYRSADELAVELSRVNTDAGRKVVIQGAGGGDRGERAPARPHRDAGANETPEGGKIRIRMDGGSEERPQSPRSPAPQGGLQEGQRIRISGPAGEKKEPKSPKREEAPVRGAKGGDPGKSLESRLIKLSLDRMIVTLIPGQPTSLRATVFNGTKLVDHFEFAVEGLPANWVQLPAIALQLNPGDRGATAITVNVPRTPQSVARTYAVTVRVTARRQSAEYVTATGEWTVTPYTQTNMTLSPSRQRAWRSATFGARITNGGNTPVRFALVAQDDESVLRYRFGETAVSLAPGDSASLEVSVRSRLRPIGSTETRSFTVRAEPIAGTDGTPPRQDQGPAIASGQYLHRPIIPLWVPPLLLLLAAGLWWLMKDRGKIQLAFVPASAEMSMSVGSTSPLGALVTDKKGNPIDSLAKLVRWGFPTGVDTTIAAKTDSGVRGLRKGETVLRASVPGYPKDFKDLKVTVAEAAVASLSIIPAQLNLAVGARSQLRAIARDGQGKVLQRSVQWIASGGGINVANGIVVASDTGVSTVTAMVEGLTASALVSVRPSAAMQAAAGAAAAAGEADCQAYDPATLTKARDRTLGWMVKAGGAVLLLLDDENDANRALQLARGYKNHCFLGRRNTRPNRSNFIIEYWTDPSGAPIDIVEPDCAAYTAAALRVVDKGPEGFALVANNRTVLNADKQSDAQKIWEIAQRYSAQCFIGRGNNRPNQRDYVVQYWR